MDHRMGKQRGREREEITMSSTDDVLRALPHALGPEKSILSSMMKDPVQFIQRSIEEGLSPDHFYLPSHAIICETLLQKFDAGEEIELVSFVQKLLDLGNLEKVGGAHGVTDLYSYDASGGAYFDHHLQLVKEKYILRELCQFSNLTIAAVYDAPDESKETLADAERRLTIISALAHGCDMAPTTRQALKESFEEFERRVKGGEDAMGLPTYPALDAKIRGLHAGRMYVPGAYPEGGKSTFSSEIVCNLVVSGVPCAYIILEGTEKDLMTRMIIQTAGIVAQAYTDPKGFARDSGGPEVSKLTKIRIEKAIRDLAAAPLYVRRPPGNKLSTILAILRRFHREHGIKVAVIDYAQRIKGTKSESREIEQTECSNAIQSLASELGIAIIVPSQLNDDGDTKHGKVWQEDADAVFRIVQDRNKDSVTYKRHRHIAIDKDRHNGSGGQIVPLVLDRDRVRFVEGPDETEGQNKKPKFTR